MTAFRNSRVLHDRAGGRRLVEGLARGGVSMAFGLDDPRGFFAALRQSDLGAHVVHDERAGGFMADGYARVTGRPTACSGISGPGAANLAPALLEAWGASVPLVAVVGELLPPRPGLRAFQQADHASFLGAGLTKAVVEVSRGAELCSAAEQAARLATSGRPRPVLLLVPDALLWEDTDVDDAAPAPSAPPPEPDRAALDRAHAALAAARRPVILAGNGVNIAAAHAELVELAERCSAPVATSMSGKGAIAETHPLSVGVASTYTSGREGRGALAFELLREADVILVVGSDLDALTTVDWALLSGDATIVRIDIDPAEMGAIEAIELLGDAREVLDRLTALCTPGRGADAGRRLAVLAEAKAARAREVHALDRNRRTDGHVWPGAVMAELSERLRPEDWIVADASYSSGWALDRIVQARAGRQVIAPRGVGTLGWAVPAGMGVQLAAPDADVTVVSGDGALLFALPELETAVRWGLGITVVLLDNGVYGSQRHSNLLAQGRDYEDLHFGAAIEYPALVRSLGWRATRVTTDAEFAEAYAAARASGEPWLIDVATDPEARPAHRRFDELG